jgi:glycerol-3-phosphate acyltransferase PlsY
MGRGKTIMNAIVLAILIIPIAFLCGALPFSVWLAKLFTGQDVRQFGDGSRGTSGL